METIVLSATAALDQFRALVLRWGLSVHFLRAWFSDRALRSFSLFLLTSAIYLPLSLFFPLWVLAIGPLIWGIPHLFSSMRYQSLRGLDESKQKNKPQRIFYFLFAVWLLAFGFRLGTDFFNLNIELDSLYPGLIEASLAVITAVGALLIYRMPIQKWFLSSVILMTLFYFTWHFPVATAGVLILAHNFIAFFYWILLSPSKPDRVFASIATAIFTLIHVLILSAVFDPIINLVSVESFLSWAQLDVDRIGRVIAPWSEDGNLFYRLTVLYAFGQSLHYFIWLKAIPDLQTPTQTPTSFRSAWLFLKRDMGYKIAAAACILALLPLAVWLLQSFAVASQFYFAAASYHGYMEIAGLGLLLQRFKI